MQKLERQKRVHKITTMLNDKEQAAIDRYFSEYKVKNKSKFIRDMVFSSIWKSYDRDYPTLFSPKVMAELIVETR